MAENFRSIHHDKGVTRTRLEACGYCDAQPGPGEKPFPSCSGCKRPVYCSKECQKLAWKVHKPLCNYARETAGRHEQFISTHRSLFPSNDELLQVDTRANLLQSFTRVHSFYFQRTLHYVLRYLRLEETFDFANTYLHVSTSYREDCDNNPSIAFRVDGMEVRPLAQLKASRSFNAAALIEASRLTDELEEAREREMYPNFLGTITSVLVAERCLVCTKAGTVRLLPTAREYQKYLEMHIGDRWLGDFQNLVEKGLTFTQPGDDGFWRLGSFKKKGKNWRWKQLTSAELVSLGFPSDYRLI